MSRKLRTFVTVHERDGDGNPTGRSGTFGPTDSLPNWAEAAISNPDVWDDGSSDVPVQAGPSASVGGGADSNPDPDVDSPPPKGGAGSGAPAWREYAARNGVQVSADASREDVIAALEAAQVRTE